MTVDTAMKTVVVAMKTVVVEKNCATREYKVPDHRIFPPYTGYFPVLLPISLQIIDSPGVGFLRNVRKKSIKVANIQLFQRGRQAVVLCVTKNFILMDKRYMGIGCFLT